MIGGFVIGFVGLTLYVVLGVLAHNLAQKLGWCNED